jgi:hypothetical protein
MRRLSLLAAACAAFAFGHAQAAVVSSLPGATSYAIAPLNEFTAGPVAIAPGITWSAGSPNSVYGWTGGYGFGSNGVWSGVPMIGTNTPTSSMRIDFTTAVSGFGAFFDYLPDYQPTSISAYDADGDLLDTTKLTFHTGNASNSGQFIGFKEGSADISYVTMTGSYIGARSLQATAVPEPANAALLLAGLGAVGLLARRRKA